MVYDERMRILVQAGSRQDKWSSDESEGMRIEDRLRDMGVELPAEAKVPPGVVVDFAWARVHDDRVYLSGHGPQAADGAVVGPFGCVAPRSASSRRPKPPSWPPFRDSQLRRAIGSLDRVGCAWMASC